MKLLFVHRGNRKSRLSPFLLRFRWNPWNFAFSARNRPHHILQSKAFWKIQQKSFWVISPRKFERSKNHENLLWKFHFFFTLFLWYAGQKCADTFFKCVNASQNLLKKGEKNAFFWTCFFKNTTCLRSKSSRTYGTPLSLRFMTSWKWDTEAIFSKIHKW